MEGLGKLEISGHKLTGDKDLKEALTANADLLAHPAMSAELQRRMRRQRLKVEASLPSATATVIDAQSRPELNGAEVTIRKYLKEKGNYIVWLPPGADGEQERVNLKPANLVLAEGSAVVATGLTGAPELNGQRGIVEGWLEEKGRYAVRLEDKRRTKAANLRPENCIADVLVL